MSNINIFNKPKYVIEFYRNHDPNIKWKFFVRANSEEEALKEFFKEFNNIKIEYIDLYEE
jgi:hypothetical protein